MRFENTSVISDVTNNLFFAPLCNSHLGLATKIAERSLFRNVNLPYEFMDPRKFSVGEFCPKFQVERNDPKGKSAWMILTPSPRNSPESLMYRACMTARALKEHGAKKVSLLTTDLPHARQDRGPEEDLKAKGELNTVKLHASLLRASGIDQIVTTHSHSPRISSFFALENGLISNEFRNTCGINKNPYELIPGTDSDPNRKDIQELGKSIFKPISPHAIVADYMRRHSSLKNSAYMQEGGARIVLKAMDRGNRNFIDNLYKALYLPNASILRCEKARKKKNDPNSVEVEVSEFISQFDSINGMCEVYADDGLDTGGTMIRAAKWSDEGNRCREKDILYGTPEVRAVYFTHPWLGGKDYNSIQRKLIEELPSSEFITSNTRPHVSDGQYHRFEEKSTVLRFAALWADAILADEQSIDITTRYQDYESEQEQHRYVSQLYALKRHSRHFMQQDRVKKREMKFALR
jgi:phosphoribosylpyrophosphate synthetase